MGGGICVFQGWFSHSYYFLPPPNILPVFVGTHFIESTQIFLQCLYARVPWYFENKEIGCRDLYTLRFCEKMGFSAYFSRCLTLTLPKRKITKSQNKVFLVNITDDILHFIPKSLISNAQIINQRYVQIKENATQEYFFVITKNLLERYKNEASLVITTALHCAAPCVALGIPVVLIQNDKTEQNTRFCALVESCLYIILKI